METQWIKLDQYNQAKVDKYNDRYSIILGNQGQDDVIYPKFCAPQVWRNGEKQVLKKDGNTVFVPISIPLGNDKEKAIAAVGALYHQLKNL